MTNWLSTQPTSHWQQGCNDGKAGKPRREPGQPGIADMANVGYMNGWHFGRQQRLKEQTACGVAACEPFAWEWRFFDTAHEPPGWGEWKRLTPHTRIQSDAEALAEMRDFIKGGFHYQLRPIYAGAVEGYLASGVRVVRECCNAECGWKGETARMLGSVGPLCPDCGEVTEPISGVPVVQPPALKLWCSGCGKPTTWALTLELWKANHAEKCPACGGEITMAQDVSGVLEPHPPSRKCGCADCAPSFADGVRVCDEGECRAAERDSVICAGECEVATGKRTSGVAECSHCYDGGCGDPLGCGETDRRNAGVPGTFNDQGDSRG